MHSAPSFDMQRPPLKAKMETALLLGHSADWWNSATLLSLAAASIVAGFVAAATTGAVIATKREAVADRAELERYKAQAAAQVQAAKAEAAQANERAGEANERAAGLDKTAAQLRLDLEKERSKTAARPWTKEQFDAIQDVKGVVKTVGILWQNRCIECGLFAQYIELALSAAGVQIYGAHEFDSFQATGIVVFLPVGKDSENNALVAALTKAELNPQTMVTNGKILNISEDIPVIFVGERFPSILARPYQPPGLLNFQVFPIERQ
jgi:hypothetical protein